MRRLMRLALRALPPGMRARHGEDLLELYLDLARERGERPGAAFWLCALGDILWSGLLARGSAAARWLRGLPLALLHLLAPSPRPHPLERREHMLGTLWQDLRFGVRILGRSPGFTLAILVTLALGIGANTAIFSVIHGVLLQPLPYAHSEQLVLLQQPVARAGVENAGFSPLEVEDYRSRTQSFSGLVEYHSMPFSLVGRGEPQRVQTGVVSAAFFDVLGVRPLLGRTFAQGEDAPGAEPVLVLSHGFWRRAFGGDPSIVGQGFTMNGRTHTVVGVLPPVPQYPGENDVYMPVSACPFRSVGTWTQERGARGLTLLGRLRSGVSLEQARAELATASAQLHQAHPDAYPAADGYSLGAARLDEELVRKARPTLLLLLGTAAFLLLIVCTNVANLSLARLARRERELSVRVAMGASRMRLFRQLLTEHLLLSSLGGALGLAVAHAGLEVLVGFAARLTPRAVEVQLSLPALLFTAGVALGTGLLLAMLPALPARGDLYAGLKESAGATQGPAGMRLRGVFIAAQVAVSCVLLVGAGLMLRSLVKLQEVDPGFDPENVLTARVDLAWDRYREPEKVRAFTEQLLPRLEGLPGVVSVGLTNAVPLEGSRPWTRALQVEGAAPPAPGQAQPQTDLSNVNPGYFRTLGVPLVQGRTFTPDDREGGVPVVVVSQAFVRQHLGGERGEPLGRRLSFDGGRTWLSVVGVVGDVHQRGLEQAAPAVVYLPFAHNAWRDVRVLVRTRGEPQVLAGLLREQVRALDPAQPVTDVRTLATLRAEALASPRLVTVLLGAFAGLALVLTVAGLAGVVAFSVSQRLRELGIRLALGAEPASVLGLVLWQGMGMVLAGLGLGLAGALVLSRLMEGMLFGVQGTDLLTFGGVVGVLLLTAAVACVVPARRAAQVDPALALRSS